MRNLFLLIFLTLTVLGVSQDRQTIRPGCYQTDQYFPLLKGKHIVVVSNQSGYIGKTHIVDSLMHAGFNIIKIFSPEHGFRGQADAGAKVNSRVDLKTGRPIVSLYGKHKKPTGCDMRSINMVVFDIQDVGVRFYTYISTLQYVMEACAKYHVPLIVLDRPNPNGFYIDGPILDTASCRSFIGMQPIPIVYGMTIGEYARMLNGEHRLKNGDTCQLTVIPCQNYTHDSLYSLPIAPSPNLPNMTSVYLYPSLCLLEGTRISVGRGTDKPFQQYGAPDYRHTSYSFTPHSMKGAHHPKFLDQRCYGVDVSKSAKTILQKKQLNLHWLIDAYHNTKNKAHFFKSSFNLLAGNKLLQEQIKRKIPATAIRQSWQNDLEKFKAIRKKYLLYK